MTELRISTIPEFSTQLTNLSAYYRVLHIVLHIEVLVNNVERLLKEYMGESPIVSKTLKKKFITFTIRICKDERKIFYEFYEKISISYCYYNLFKKRY